MVATYTLTLLIALLVLTVANYISRLVRRRVIARPGAAEPEHSIPLTRVMPRRYLRDDGLILNGDIHHRKVSRRLGIFPHLVGTYKLSSRF